MQEREFTVHTRAKRGNLTSDPCVQSGVSNMQRSLLLNISVPPPRAPTTQRNGRVCLDCSFQLTFNYLSTHCESISPTCPQGPGQNNKSETGPS